MAEDTPSATRREKMLALFNVATYSPRFTLLVVGLGLLTAAFEGVGLGFILPIIEIVQLDDPTAEADGILLWFVLAYETLGVPFTLGYVILGVTSVIAIRYTLGFLVNWFQAALSYAYMRALQKRAYKNALRAEVAYFDEEGSDDILNTIITETRYGAKVIKYCVRVIELLFLSAVYVVIALVISPLLTAIAVILLGALTLLLRGVLDPGYRLGSIVADANERRQKTAQAGTQGIRDVHIFNLANELYRDFSAAVDRYTNSIVRIRRNEAALDNFFRLGVAVAVFALIYLGLTVADLSIGALGLFLFAMYQLGPKVSSMNEYLYMIENNLPHLVRTQQFIAELEARQSSETAMMAAPAEINTVEFDDVRFSYDENEEVLAGMDFRVEKGEFIAFVGKSGVGKTTIISLLARLYEPDDGEIKANGVPIDLFDIDGWQQQVAVVRQNPYMFNDTLRYNLTIGNRDATREEIERACEIARVDEFFPDLPNGYDTPVGDEGVRLSGGQRQRVALARALLTDADLLLLDEATSDLDSQLEQDVQRAIEAMEQEYVTIAIAHRLSTVEHADRLYTLDNGEITEVGTHDELIDNDGQYADLYSVQS